MVEVWKSLDEPLIQDDSKLLRQIETGFIQLAQDWNFGEEIVLPQISPFEWYGDYADNKLDLIVDFEGSDGRKLAFAPEYRTVTKNLYSTAINLNFFNTGKVISYTNLNRLQTKEKYVICIHSVNPNMPMSKNIEATKWIYNCGRDFDSKKGFNVNRESRGSILYTYNNALVGFLTRCEGYINAVIDITECVKQYNLN